MHCPGHRAPWAGYNCRRWALDSPCRECTGAFPTLIVLRMEISLSFLGAVYLRPKRNLWEGAKASALVHQLEKTNGKWDVSSLFAVVNCWSSTCLPLPLSFQLVGFTLFRSLFLILTPSLSPSWGIFFQMQSMYISFFLHKVFLPPWQYFSCSNLLSSRKDINPILLNPAS